jgi:hypothetical protein
MATVAAAIVARTTTPLIATSLDPAASLAADQARLAARRRPQR